jgi:hypothetical protein
MPIITWIEQEPQKAYVDRVPFEFAAVAICEDDFKRVWLSALELKYKGLKLNEYELIPGELRVFEVTPQD